MASFETPEDHVREQFELSIAASQRRIDAANDALRGSLSEGERIRMAQELHEATLELRGFQETLDSMYGEKPAEQETEVSG